jgi:transposase-like protein
MLKSNPFKWRGALDCSASGHYQPEIILLCVRWYLPYPLSYRQVAEMVSFPRVGNLSHNHLPLGTAVWTRAKNYVADLTWSQPMTQQRVDETYIARQR